MSQQGDDAASRLWWGLRRYVWLVAVGLVLGAALAAVAGPSLLDDEVRYEASALVVASELTLRPEMLPDSAERIFASAAVLEPVVTALGLDEDPEDLVPERLRLETATGSVVLAVVGVAGQPEQAAQLADAAATSLVSTLNGIGPGFGSFKVLRGAARPSDPEPGPPGWLAPALGVLSGLAFGLGLVGLVLAVRRPVLRTADLADLDAPVLGELRLPRGGAAAPAAVPGLMALSRRLQAGGATAVVYVGTAGDEDARTDVAVLHARALARHGRVRLVAEHEPDLATFDEHERARVELTTALAVDQADDGVPAVIEGPAITGLDVPHFLPARSQVVLVAGVGRSQRQVRDAVEQFLPEELLGVLLVSRRRRHAEAVT